MAARTKASPAKIRHGDFDLEKIQDPLAKKAFDEWTALGRDED